MNIKDIFFKNVGMRQTVFKNTFWLTLAELVTSLLRFFLIVYAVRMLGASEYGKFSFALSFASLFAIGSDLGLSVLITREFSQKKENEQNYPALISLKILLSFLVLALTLASSFFVSQDSVVQKMIWILSAFIFVDGFFTLVYPFIRARQRMEYEALAKILQTTLTVLFGFYIIHIYASPVYFSLAYFFASVIVLALVAFYFHTFIYFLKLDFNLKLWKDFLKESWPLTFGFIGIWVYINVDSAMIGFFGTASEVGWFNAANRIIFAVIVLFAGLVSRSFYPVLSRFFNDSKEELQKSWEYYLRIMILFSVPLVIGGIVLAPKIIGFLYGLEKYSSSVFSFQALIVASGISLLCYPYSMMLVISNQQKKNFFIILSGLCANTILNLVLIPLYGFNAASISTAISCAIVLAFSFAYAQYYITSFTSEILTHVLFSIISAMAMLLVIIQPAIYHFNVFILLLVGSMVYIGCLLTLLFLKRIGHKSQ